MTIAKPNPVESLSGGDIRRSTPRTSPWFIWCVLVGDAIAAVVAGLIGLPWPVVILVLPSIAWSGAYDPTILGAGSEEFKRVFGAVVRVLMVSAAVAFVLHIGEPNRAMLLGAVALFVTALASRLVTRRLLWALRRRGIALVPTVVVGWIDDKPVDAAFAGDQFTGMVAVASVGGALPGQDDESWISMINDCVRATDARAVVVIPDPALPDTSIRRLASAIELTGTELYVASGLDDFGTSRLSIRPGPDMTLVHVADPRLTGPKRFMKRLFDLVLGLVLFVIALPVIIVSSFLVTLTSPGWPLYPQQRIGQGGRPFTCWKIRTMSVGAHRQREEILGVVEVVPDSYQSDPRITRVGKVLRRFSIDELPQLFSVLRGSMSLVGPRPVLPEEYATLSEENQRRQLAKPGVTGMWQVSGRKDVPWDERIRLDIDYLETWSLTLDVVLILRTVKAVIVGRGAY